MFSWSMAVSQKRLGNRLHVLAEQVAFPGHTTVVGGERDHVSAGSSQGRSLAFGPLDSTPPGDGAGTAVGQAQGEGAHTASSRYLRHGEGGGTSDGLQEVVGGRAVDVVASAQVDELFGDGHADVAAARDTHQDSLLVHFVTQFEHQAIDFGYRSGIAGFEGQLDLVGKIADRSQQSLKLRHGKPLFE